MCSLQDAIECAKSQLEEVIQREVFSPCDLSDIGIGLVLKGAEASVSWSANTPRGAVFLGELASVGFFGVEAQQLLS